MTIQVLLTTSIKLLFFACLMLLSSCNEVKDDQMKSDRLLPHVAKSILQLNQAEGIVYFKGTPFSGYAVTFYNSEVFSAKSKYLGGKKNGKEQKWFQNGTLSYDANFENGLLHGKSTSWWENGNKRTESNFVNGISHGVQNQWYKSGAKFKRILLENGKEEGMQHSWRENGKLYNNYEAKNGRIFGLRRSKLCFQIADEKIQISPN